MVDPPDSCAGGDLQEECEDIRESPAMHVVDALRKDGYDVAHFDPLVPNMRCPSLRRVAEGVDLIAVLVSHDAIRRELADDREAIERAMRHNRIRFFDE